MTAVDQPIPSPSPGESPVAGVLRPPGDPAGQLLARVFDVFDREGLPYCVTHAYADLPQRVASDVDCLMPRDMLPRRVADLLRRHEQTLGARLLQWFEERSHFVVLQGIQPGADGRPVMLQLHISSDFEVADRVIVGGAELLRTRRSLRDQLWVPAPHVEFACVLANRIEKGGFEPHHLRQLAALWSADPARCGEQLERMFRPHSWQRIASAAAHESWDEVTAVLPEMRREMKWRLAAQQPLSFACRWIGRQLRRIKRWSMPHGGLHVVFLGPDGVGKSTVIDGVKQRVAPAFLRTDVQTFARRPFGTSTPKATPHELPPRSLPASLLKAAWWLACYTIGYYLRVYPTLARCGLVMNHRYLLDTLVDPARYRYGGPMGLLQAIWRVAPKPDLVIILDAPPEVIHARKQETPLEETRRQRDAYVALGRTLPYAKVVDTAQPAERTIEQVTEILLSHIRDAVARRLKLK